MNAERFEVFGLGQCTLDYLGTVEAYPPADAKCEFGDLTIQGGGPVASALVALSRWGATCAFAGVVGDDEFGGGIRASLDGEGIDTRGLLVRKGHGSQFAFIVAEKSSGARNIFYRRPDGPPPALDEIDFDSIRTASVFHTDGFFPDASIAAAKVAKGAGVEVCVDAGSLKTGMLELARSSDHFIASEVFARAFVGKDDPLEACKRLADLGPRLAAVTLGARGYVALAEGKPIVRPAHPAKVVDTTGCGDAFHAGYIYGSIKGWSVEKRLDFAAWVAAAASTRLGGRAGIPEVSDYPFEPELL